MLVETEENMNISVLEEYLREDVESRLLISVFSFFFFFF